MPKHATRTSFVKGKSGNPGGLTKTDAAKRLTIQDLFGPLQDQAMDNIKGFLRNDKDKRMQWEVTQYVVERLHGKVVERKEISGADGGAIKIEDNTPSVRILLQQALGPVIEGEKG